MDGLRATIDEKAKDEWALYLNSGKSDHFCVLFKELKDAILIKMLLNGKSGDL